MIDKLELVHTLRFLVKKKDRVPSRSCYYLKFVFTNSILQSTFTQGNLTEEEQTREEDGPITSLLSNTDCTTTTELCAFMYVGP